MIVSNLFDKALVEPAKASNRLFIVSGFATAAFAKEHLEALDSRGLKAEVHLIVGMPGKRSDHLAFLDLHKRYAGRFAGYYVSSPPPVHSKVYGWFNGGTGKAGFAGSANYSGYGFKDKQQTNQLSADDPQLIRDFFEKLLPKSVAMPKAKVAAAVGHRPVVAPGDVPAGAYVWEIPDVRARISFLDRTGTLPKISGINWGQRLAKSTKKDGTVVYAARNPDQAYLSLRGNTRAPGFLPPRAIRFTLVTDDGLSFDCVRGQDGDKAIHTTDDNALLGRYLRQRFGLKFGAPVTKQDLLKYGRTDYTVEKLDDETFLLDVSVTKKK